MVRSYLNGTTAGTPGPGVTPETAVRRDRITGWSAAAVRRHTRWLYSVDPDLLEVAGNGFALTLTLRETPATAAEWQALRRAWWKWCERNGLILGHWVVEWQRRGTPHLHCALYFAMPTDPMMGALSLGAWVQRARKYGARVEGQHVAEIEGAVGWLQYLSKHAARGVAHYQRQGKPSGWESTGRLWGHTGDWPTIEPVDTVVSRSTFWRFRRLARAWRVADARAAVIAARTPEQRRSAVRRLVYARSMLRCSDPALSAVRGVSEWIPLPITVALLDLLSAQDTAGGQGAGPLLPASMRPLERSATP